MDNETHTNLYTKVSLTELQRMKEERSRYYAGRITVADFNTERCDLERLDRYIEATKFNNSLPELMKGLWG